MHIKGFGKYICITFIVCTKISTLVFQMAGRGGRGAALKQILEAKRREEEEKRPGSLPTTSTDDTTGSHAPGIPSPSTSSPSHASEPAPKHIGRGRLLQQLLAKGVVPTSGTPGPGGDAPSSPPTQQMKALSISKSKPPSEPVYFRGELGQPIKVMVNYIDLSVKEGSGMYEYEVKFNPPIDSRGIRNRLINSLNDLLGQYKTFDGMNLFLPFKLSSDTVNTTCQTREGSDVQITIIFKRQRQFYENLMFYNILFRKIAFLLSMVQFKDCLYDPRSKLLIPQYKLEVWPGFVTAIDEYEGGLKLQIDTSCRVLRTSTCLDLIDELKEKFGGNFMERLSQALIGEIVLTRYNNQTYRIDEIDFKQTPMSTFTKRGEPKSYVDYYREAYNIEIRDKSQPMLITRVKRKTRRGTNVEESHYIAAIVPELAFLTGLSDAMRNDFQVMKSIASFTRVDPNQKLQAISKYINNVNNNKETSELLKGWGLTLNKSMETLNARILPVEKIYMGNNFVAPGSQEADWNRQVGTNPALTVVNFDQWVLIHIRRDQRNADNFLNCLNRNSNAIGIRVKKPQVIALQEEQTLSYLTALKSMRSDTQFVVIIFNAPRTDRYQAVKKYCCCERPIPSQVINSRTISREDKMKSIVMKIALQINCKLGGSLWSVQIPYDCAMVIGIDVYHEGVGSQGQNIVGLVASTNKDFTTYYSQAVIQRRGQEITDSIAQPFKQALDRFIQANSVPPKQIFIFRDGVSDGQLDSVSRVEIDQYQQIVDTIMTTLPSCSYAPKITAIIVQKRINTKIFQLLSAGERPNLANAPSGSVLDHTVTRKTLSDFFLVSQHVRQGTVTPSHYIVLRNDNNVKVDHLQRLSYKLCHLYYNWPGTIRVPAVCQYAHRIAYLTGMHLQRLPSDVLSDKLFYL
jgi:PAZ domain./Piwi domain.